MELKRCGFIKLTGAGLAGSTLAAIGFGAAGDALAAAVRPFKLAATTETRNTCTYCAVACGILVYSAGDRAKNAKSNIIHIEGDPDHPVSRGTLCPKGSALLDVVHAPTRLKAPKYRAPGSNEFKQVSWNLALDRIARLMKQDRDANFIAKNAAGATVLAVEAAIGATRYGATVWPGCSLVSMTARSDDAYPQSTSCAIPVYGYAYDARLRRLIEVPAATTASKGP